MDVCTPIKWFIACILFVAVLAIFISPAFHMPESILYARSLAQLIFLVLTSLASFPVGLLIAPAVVGRVQCDNSSPTFAPFVNLALPLLC